MNVEEIPLKAENLVPVFVLRCVGTRRRRGRGCSRSYSLRP